MLWPAARSLLFRLDPERVHGLAIPVLRALGRPAVAGVVRPAARPALRTRCLGLDFPNPLGMAAGFDKGEVIAPGLFALGFGAVEIGTITPRPQPGNPRPRLFRLPQHRAILNRMGFNNDGAETCAARLAALRPEDRPGVLGVNIGKNKVTPNEEAEKDYLACIDRLHPFADYLVVNLSSPNTPGLRELQGRAHLERLLGACMNRLGQLPRPPPLLVKLAPDLTPEALDEAVDVALESGVQGIVATNTTIQRPGPVASHRRAGEAGGLSGAPLEALATAAVKRIYVRVGTRLPVIGVGGVMTAASAYAKIRAGSSLVQAYTGFIYGGPRFVPEVLSGLEALLKRDGFARLEDAVGADCR
ncbi:quinone-dependent dihydroorotate dehydrogenase [Anaeromyxobacter paludicola]|uniref:Dihydroorotate dehydrogenase (quinone) n=1 Tax=Anaeromyxobacter paludicola TaxID=2918171 RepID=A0ABN6N4X0_9BACT|nr:quinone-dependent dihydroorotate dehydrogenase [Anaeromyxobacter paludicola]BDG08056.1 dihydroorotate dehydrogenase (quinone) [Anaeromyxobacter paludicola]